MTEQVQINDIDKKVPQSDTNTQEVSNSDAKSGDSAVKSGEENPNEINWRKFRQEREKERKEKLESDRKAAEKEKEVNAMKAAMEALLTKPAQTQQQAPDDSYDETEEQRIERKVQETLDKMDRKREEDRRKKEHAELPQTLSKAFGDFNVVCSEENLDYLEYHYPEVVAGLKHMPESFDKWATIYRAAKRFIPNTDQKKDLAKIEKNSNKPQSMSVPGSTQTGDHAPTEMTERRRQDNWARMTRVMKGTK